MNAIPLDTLSDRQLSGPRSGSGDGFGGVGRDGAMPARSLLPRGTLGPCRP